MIVWRVKLDWTIAAIVNDSTANTKQGVDLKEAVTCFYIQQPVSYEEIRYKEARRLHQTRKTTAKMGGLCEERSEKGRGGSKVERKGQQQGPMETNSKSSRTSELPIDQPHSNTGKTEEQQQQPGSYGDVKASAHLHFDGIERRRELWQARPFYETLLHATNRLSRET